VRRAFEKFRPELIISVHPLLQTVSMWAMQGMPRRIPFVTGVTDLSTGHPLWFNAGVDACYVASEYTAQLAARRGLRPDQIHLYGLPIRPAFARTPRPKPELRRALGMALDLPAVLLIGGGEGIGPVEQIAHELSRTLAPSGGSDAAGKGKGDSEVRRSPKSSDALSAFVFKMVPSEVGRMALVRVVSGKLTADSNVFNSTHDKSERVGQLYLFTPGKRASVNEAHPGDIVGLAKLKATRIGDTLCDEKDPVRFPLPHVPAPVVRYALLSKGKTDEAKLAQKLNDIKEEDLSLKIEYDAATKETIIGGCGPVHIEVTLEKLRRASVEVELAPPRIPYLETIRGRAKNVEGKHKKQTGGKGQFGVVYLDLEPAPRGSGLIFEDAIVGGAVPRQFIPAVEKGIKERMSRGGLAGYQCTDVKVRLFDGKYHDVDSDSRSFEMAGSKAFLAAFKQAHPVILEPHMKIEVVCPEDHMGQIIGDLNNRRAKIAGMEARGRMQVIKATLPMSETLDYSAFLRSATGGRGGFTLEASHYEEMPAHLADKVIAAAKKTHDEDEE